MRCNKLIFVQRERNGRGLQPDHPHAKERHGEQQQNGNAEDEFSGPVCEVECHPHADTVVYGQVLVVRVVVDQPIDPVAVIICKEALPAFCGERFLCAAGGKLRADADDHKDANIAQRKQEDADGGIEQEPEAEAEQPCEPGESDPGAPPLVSPHTGQGGGQGSVFIHDLRALAVDEPVKAGKEQHHEEVYAVTKEHPREGCVPLRCGQRVEDGHKRHHKRGQEPQGAHHFFRERRKAEIHKRFTFALRRGAGLLLIGTEAFVALHIGNIGHDHRGDDPDQTDRKENGCTLDREQRDRQQGKDEHNEVQLPQKLIADGLHGRILPRFKGERYAEDDVLLGLRFIAQHEIYGNKAEIQDGKQEIFHGVIPPFRCKVCGRARRTLHRKRRAASLRKRSAGESPALRRGCPALRRPFR